jgi:hypothetical protein
MEHLVEMNRLKQASNALAVLITRPQAANQIGALTFYKSTQRVEISTVNVNNCIY